MSPDRSRRRRANTPVPPVPPSVRTRPGPDDTYDVAYFKRHVEDDPQQAEPGREFLRCCPQPIAARMVAVVVEVAAAPPHRFAGGGYWEAMHGELSGYHEVRVDGPKRTHYRLFCRLDTEAIGRGPLLTILWGASKKFRTTFSAKTYAQARAFGEEYLSRNPRSVS